MYLITPGHTVPYSICILWGRFVSADGSPLSGMRTKAVPETKTGSSDFRIYYSPKHKLSHCHSIFFVVWSGCFVFSSDKQEIKMFQAFLLYNLDISLHCILFSDYLMSLLFCFHPVYLCFPWPGQSKLLHRVTCTCQSCIVRIQHIPLAWQTWFIWSRCSLTATRGA